MDVLGGIEGGATSTKLVLVKLDGTILTWVESPGSNYYIVGRFEAVKQFAAMVEKAKRQASLPLDKPIKGLGMALSGAENEAFNDEMIEEFQKSHPEVAQNYCITTDSVGTIMASSPNGGIVMIAGTGSSARLLNPDGNIYGCGAWGHIIGDQGSSWWVTISAVRAVYDGDDGLVRCPFDTSFVKTKLLEFFGVKNKVELLDHVYLKFDKSEFSKFCAVISEGARVHNDPLCRHLFRENGIWLGRHILGVAKNADKSLFDQDGGLAVVTVGSVWKSFDLMKQGLIQGLQPRDKDDVKIATIRLLRLTASPAIGAAHLVADKAKVILNIDYSKNTELLFETEL